MGSLQFSVTRLPLRVARRSVGGLGSSSDGGSGGPVWAQLVSSRQNAIGALNLPRYGFMREKKEYQRQRADRLETFPVETRLAAFRHCRTAGDGASPVSTANSTNAHADSSCQFAHGFAKNLAVAVDVIGRGCRRHQRHVVKGREQDAAIHGVEMHEAFKLEVHGIVSILLTPF